MTFFLLPEAMSSSHSWIRPATESGATGCRPSTPNRVLETPSTSSLIVTQSAPFRAARSAASLTTFASSAPEKPAVSRAATAAASSRGMSSSRGTPRRWMPRISRRPASLGSVTTTLRLSRPGRSSAGSSASGRFVAASRRTPSRPSNPSSSVSSWLSVWSRSSLFPNPLFIPTASSSSMKTTQGARLRASAKRSRTRAAPRPTKSSTNSDADAAKNGTPASPATALAKRVFPVPGGPDRSTPEGILAFSFLYRPASLRQPTTSISSTLAPSTPATSLKVTAGARGPELCFFARLGPPRLSIMRRSMKMRGSIGSHTISIVKMTLETADDIVARAAPKLTSPSRSDAATSVFLTGCV
mmetsp:Transcript_33111/g.78529  ORF Transcript_33111/g.78529 Transcript_33111/m.78529 type:complete len:357 (-) Transcript_33111:822-1892(-)